MEKGSAEITATAIVKSVQNYVKLSDEEIAKNLSDNQNKLHLSKEALNKSARMFGGEFFFEPKDWRKRPGERRRSNYSEVP